MQQLFDWANPAGEISIRDLWSWQGGVAAIVLGLSALYVRRLHRRLAVSSWVGALLDRLAPATVLCVLTAAAIAASAAFGESAPLLRGLLELGVVMLIARLLLHLLLRSLAATPKMTMMERVVGWIAGLSMAMLLFHWIAPAMQTLDAISLAVAGTRVSLLDAIRVAVVLLLILVVAIYLGAFIERRVLGMSAVPIGMRVGIAKVSRVLLVVLAMLVALNSVGMNLSAFTVVGGAVGVGLGFGLQRIASNFISGFVLLGDRSIRPGDVITIGTRVGVVRELRARYVVVRDRDGVDTLIPNENIITSEVINWSYGDRRIRLKLPVMISYQDNPRAAMKLMEDAARAHPRVESDPAPAARVMSFAESGIELELRFWIRDPEDGVNNVRSDLFLEIWDAFKAASVTIPYPQREVHLRGLERPGDATPEQS